MKKGLGGRFFVSYICTVTFQFVALLLLAIIIIAVCIIISNTTDKK